MTDKGLRFKDHKEIARHPEIAAMLMNEIGSLQKDFARYEKIKKIIIPTEPLNVENGELTPSMKIK